MKAYHTVFSDAKCNDGRWHYARRVPSRYADFDGRGYVRKGLLVRALGTPTAQEALDIQNIENFIIGLQTDPIIMSALANVNLAPMLRVAIIDPVIQSRSATFFSNLPGLEISRRFQAHPAIDLIVADRGGGKRIQVEDQTIVYLLS